MSRFLTTLLLLLITFSNVLAEEELRVFEQQEINPPSEMMHRWLLQQVDHASSKWRTDYETRTTPQQIAAYQARMRKFFLDQIGGLPDRTPLNAQVTGKVLRQGYHVEKVLFESQPKHYVTGALFLPEQAKYKPPYPGVLVVCGHSADGKAYDGYQTACALLALNGMAAFIIDPIAQGERHQTLDDHGKPDVPSSTTQHSLIGLGSILLGQNTARFEIWDGMRAIDYLQSRPEVKPERIGCMGNSGGGTQTSYLVALDDRIKAASPSCYITSFERLLNTIGPQDAEQNIAGQIGFGMDHADYLMMRAPTPILLCAATKDYFDITGTWQAFRNAKRLYSRLGLAERIELVEHDASHGYAKPLREAAVRWMLRWLADRDDAISEPAIELLTRDELEVTSGQVMLLDDARSVYDLNRDENERLAQVRQQLWKDPHAALEQVRITAGIRKLEDLPKPKVDKGSSTERDGLQIKKITFSPEEGIPLPALLITATSVKSAGRVLYLDERGKSAALEPTSEAAELARAGHSVLVVDVRGVGETQPVKAQWYDKRFGIDARDQVIAYLLGKSYVGMRAEDTLVCARWLNEMAGEDAGKGVHLIATGHLCTPALHAAALAPDSFNRVTLHQPLESWSRAVKESVQAQDLVHVVHGALRVYDLSDLIGVTGDKLQIVDANASKE